nr:hypothetical protein [Tanacetum cinerariifolium]
MVILITRGCDEIIGVRLMLQLSALWRGSLLSLQSWRICGMPEAYLHMGAIDNALCSFIEETSVVFTASLCVAEGKRGNEVAMGPGDAVQGKTSQTDGLECLVFGGLLHRHSPLTPFELKTTVCPIKITQSFTIRLLQLMLNVGRCFTSIPLTWVESSCCDHVKSRQRSLIQCVLKIKTTGFDIETVDFDIDGIVMKFANAKGYKRTKNSDCIGLVRGNRTYDHRCLVPVTNKQETWNYDVSRICSQFDALVVFTTSLCVTEGKRGNEVATGPRDAVQGKTSQTDDLECLVFGGLLHRHTILHNLPIAADVECRQRSLIQCVLKRKTTGFDIETVDFDIDGIVMRRKPQPDTSRAASVFSGHQDIQFDKNEKISRATVRTYLFKAAKNEG